MKNLSKKHQEDANYGERVLVYVRIRPFNEMELEKDSTCPFEVIDLNNNALICKQKVI